jgi:hypothetical protein
MGGEKKGSLEEKQTNLLATVLNVRVNESILYNENQPIDTVGGGGAGSTRFTPHIKGTVKKYFFVLFCFVTITIIIIKRVLLKSITN